MSPILKAIRKKQDAAAYVGLTLSAVALPLVFVGTLVFLCLCLAGCNDEQGPKPKIPDGGRPFAVPEVTGWDVLAIVVLALVVAALVEKWIKGDK